MKGWIHVELNEAGGAEGMSAVDHYAGDAFSGVVVLFAEQALLFVQ